MKAFIRNTVPLCAFDKNWFKMANANSAVRCVVRSRSFACVRNDDTIQIRNEYGFKHVIDECQPWKWFRIVIVLQYSWKMCNSSREFNRIVNKDYNRSILGMLKKNCMQSTSTLSNSILELHERLRHSFSRFTNGSCLNDLWLNGKSGILCDYALLFSLMMVFTQ